MVKAAYSSGKPAIGVGAGNTPVIVDETADIKMTVNYTLMSKTFDNGVICASEQAVIVDEKIYDEVKKEFDLRGAYILKKTELDKVRNTIFIDGALNSKIVGIGSGKSKKEAEQNAAEYVLTHDLLNNLIKD